MPAWSRALGNPQWLASKDYHMFCPQEYEKWSENMLCRKTFFMAQGEL